MRTPLQSGFISRFASLAIAASVLIGSAELALAQDDVSALFDRAAEEFNPVTDKELADARSEVAQRTKEVERFVRPASANGKRWLSYLGWEELTKALAAEERPDPRPLVETYQKLNRDEPGLERPQFRRLADALRRSIQLLQVANQEDQAAYYRSQLDRLKQQIDEYRREPSPQVGFEIGSRLGFLSSLGAAPELVEAVRREFAQPNAYVNVSTSLIAAGAEPIDRREVVNDCILGTNIRSNTHSVGEVAVGTIPSDDKAIIEFMSKGRTHATSVGHNGPAVIHSSSVTDFTATKRVELTDPSFLVTPSRARAKTRSNIHSVAKAGGGLGNRLVSRIGTDRAQESRPQAESIAADHAEDRIDRRFNDELNDEVQEARERYVEEYREPLARRGALPEDIRFSSDETTVNLTVTQANDAQLAAAGPPPEGPAGNDVAMQLHESAVNNYSAILIGGATASQNEPGQDIQFDVDLPDWMKDAWEERKTDADPNAADEQAFKPYSLKFRDGRPLSVKFADGKVEVTIHIARLRSGDRSFSNWDVTGIYTPELANGGVVLRRDGDLVMLPANFRGSLSSRQAAERRNLEEELNARSAQGRGFPRTIEFDPPEPSGALADAGPLEFREFASGSGWLTLALNRAQSGE